MTPQLLPLGSDALCSLHTATPVVHDTVPCLQGLAGGQLLPASHALHEPALHTLPGSHVVPFVRVDHAVVELDGQHRSQRLAGLPASTP